MGSEITISLILSFFSFFELVKFLKILKDSHKASTKVSKETKAIK